MTTAQPTFNQVYDLACMLPFVEQQRLIDYMQGNIFEHLHRTEDTPDELKSRLRASHRQALSGEVISSDEAHRMMREYVQQHVNTKL